MSRGRVYGGAVARSVSPAQRTRLRAQTSALALKQSQSGVLSVALQPYESRKMRLSNASTSESGPTTMHTT
jgi:hypothetical protein